MVIVIVGPTGAGKTSLAIQLASFYQAPIINADAFQIYEEMNIGTAKINKDDSNYYRHYLLDIVKVNETYSVKQYQDDFRKVFEKLKQNNQTIIVCGGTGLYIKAALFDYTFENENENDISDLEKMDNDSLYKMLRQIDQNEAEKIHPNNRKRVIRALQIARLHQTNKSEIIAKQKHQLFYENENIKFYFLNPDREQLYENINNRVEKMFTDGLVDEVKYLLSKYDFSLTAKEAIGYKEVIAYLANEYDLKTCKDIIKQRTRNYAKRQVTFFKHQLPCKTFTNSEDLLKELLKNI